MKAVVFSCVVLTVAVAVLGGLPAAEANDPAGSWLAYIVATPSTSTPLSYVNATVIVPKNPTQNGGGPALWWGLEPAPATNILQPILKWLGDGWYIFNEYFQWSNFYDFQSQMGQVQPGDEIFAEVVYIPSNNSYTMTSRSKRTGFSISTNIPVQQGKTYVSVYFVVEHQPFSCAQYPASGSITWTDINVVSGGKVVTDPKWTGHKFQEDCNTEPHILSRNSLKFTWDTHNNSGD